MQNLTILASAIAEISLGASKFKVGHMILTTPCLKVICHPYAGTWHSLHACKIRPLDFSCSGDMVGGHQILIGSRDKK